MKKTTQVIKITPTKKKKAYGQEKKNHFSKLSKNILTKLLSLFDEDEQIKLLTLDKKFKSAYFNINSIDENDDSKNSFKYLQFLNNLKKQSKGFSQYLNVLFNINIINLDLKSESLSIKFTNEENKYHMLILFLERFYKETELNKLLIQINENEDFNKYYSVLSSINSDLRQSLKYDLEISKSIDINLNKDVIIKLFSLISFKNINPFHDDNKTKLVEIQNYFIENNIRTEHKYIWSQKKTSIENAKKYFSINKNCLLGLNTNQSLSLCEDNKDSIDTINIPSFAISKFDHPEIKLKKIKFFYPSEEFNTILLDNIKFDNLQQISGLIITKNNLNEYITKINNLKNLKKITRIKFGSSEEEEENDNNFEEFKKKLFQDFFNGIKQSQGENLVEVTTYFYVFEKGKDYEFILNNFPNMRKIQEDYDASGLYDERIEINRIFSCNAENAFNENDLCAITKMVKNYIKQKKEGDNTIKFDMSNNFSRLAQLFEYWNKKKENEILEKINYINYMVEIGLNDNDIIELNKINLIYFSNENRFLVRLLKNVKSVNQVVIKDKNLFEKNTEFFMNKDIYSVVWNPSNLTKEECETLLKIKSLKYLIVDDKSINNNGSLWKNYPQIKIIPKKYYVDIISAS